MALTAVGRERHLRPRVGQQVFVRSIEAVQFGAQHPAEVLGLARNG